MTPALVLALALTSTAGAAAPDAHACDSAPLACRLEARNAILTWRTTAQIRGAALEGCQRDLSSTASAALTAATWCTQRSNDISTLVSVAALAGLLGLVAGLLLAHR